MFEDKPVWELLGIPQSTLKTIDAICPACKYHTAWERANDWVVCCMCFNYVGNGANKRNEESRIVREELKRRSQNND